MNRGSFDVPALDEQEHDVFNEAPIHESGKYLLGEVRQTKGLLSSMRPRFMNRGSASRAG